MRCKHCISSHPSAYRHSCPPSTIPSPPPPRDYLLLDCLRVNFGYGLVNSKLDHAPLSSLSSLVFFGNLPFSLRRTENAPPCCRPILIHTDDGIAKKNEQMPQPRMFDNNPGSRPATSPLSMLSLAQRVTLSSFVFSKTKKIQPLQMPLLSLL